MNDTRTTHRMNEPWNGSRQTSNGVSTFPGPMHRRTTPVALALDPRPRWLRLARDPHALEKVLGGVLWLTLAFVLYLNA